VNELDFSGKVVLVVGGSSGIGNGVAHDFRRRGAEVHVWGSRPSAADYDDEEGSDLTGLTYAQVDLADMAAIAAAQPTFDRLDVLVLSQGTVRYNQEEFRMDAFQAVVDVNLNSVMACAVKFHDLLAASKGSLIVISSLAAYGARLGTPAYAASKSAAVALVRTLGEAWARDGIRVNGVAPGMVPTKLTKVTVEHPDRRAAVLKGIPMRRFGTPEDISGPVLFLASPLAAYVLGQTIIADGGKGLS
jgi:3-oxoacyl-[acyl-carrier protein] reductase